MNPLQRTFEDIAQRDFDDCEELSRSELRAGRISWDYMANGSPVDSFPYRPVRVDASLPYEPQPEPTGLPPEFWRGIMIAAAASSALWVGAFYLLTWWAA